MTRFARVCLWVFLSSLISVPSAIGQSASSPEVTAPPAHLSLVEGTVSLYREGRSESAVENVPLLDGDRLRTEGGRAEVVLGDGSLLHLDRDSSVELLAGDLIRLLQGRITLVVVGARNPSLAVRYQVDAPSASVQCNAPGEYRVVAIGDDTAGTTELAVVRGNATLANEAGSVEVRAGERSVARDAEAPGRPQYFNSARWDDFDRWSATRRDEQIGTVSSRYLPEELGPYAGTLDRYGMWRYEPSNGYVWFPKVSADWRPYSVGYWREYDNWDSFWIARDPWGWPTHHYGRWGYSAGLGWYWMPARSWAAAFVYWALGGDYVSWCPLGWNDYPVFGNWGVRGVYVGLHDGWRGWTVIPRRHFGSAVFASHVQIDGRRLDSRSASSFVASRRAPSTGRAVPRAQATARARTQNAPPPGGSSAMGARGVPERARPRATAPEAARAEGRGQAERAQPTEGRLAEARPTPERYSRRTVPGAPAARSAEPGGQAVERPLQQGNSRARPQSVAPAESGGAGRIDRGRVPEAAPRAPTAGGALAAPRQRAPLPQPTERPSAPESTRTESRYTPRDRSWSTSSPAAERPPAVPAPRDRTVSSSSPAAEERARSRAPERAAPPVSSRPERAAPPASSRPERAAPPASSRPERPPSNAGPGRGSAPQSRSSNPSSRYNSGSATQRSPSRDTSSPRRGRGGAPE